MLFLLPTIVSVIPSFVEPAYSTTRTRYSEVRFTPAQTGVDPPLLIESDTEMASLGLPGDGSPGNPYVIEGLNISRVSACIRIANISASFVIRDCFLRASAGTCLRLTNVSDGRVEDCVLVGAQYAVYCEASSGVQLSGNTIYDTGHAICILDSKFCSISESTIYACFVGILFQSARNCSCVDNTIYGNTGTGVDISADSLNNTLAANILGWNSQGILGWGNSIDRGNNNTWSGNFWSDYSPPGPYNLSGSAGAQDHDPYRLIDNDLPVLDHTDQIVVVEGDETQIVWRTSDQFPLEYRISVDGIRQTTGTWTQTEIIYDLRYLAVGEHEVVLNLEDASGLEAFHTVTVRVLFNILPDIDAGLVVLASIVSIYSVVLVLLAVKTRL
ncbi:MAG: right-handed parallel beta-helix repeat-containing protein [Candidatus Hermodarchaeota archaeon]